MDKTSADQLAEALYEALLLRAPDPSGLAYHSGIGQKDGALAMVTGFLINGRKEIKAARLKASVAATKAAQERAVTLEMLGQLREDLDSIPAFTGSAAGADKVIEEIVNRLTQE